jgi:hypothetical protein
VTVVRFVLIIIIRLNYYKMRKIQKGDLVKLKIPTVSTFFKNDSVGIAVKYSSILRRWKIGWGCKFIYHRYHKEENLEIIS